MKKKSARKKKPGELQRLRLHHKIIFIVIGVTGTVLIWRGIWTLTDGTPIINHPVISIIIGFAFVTLSGVFFKLL